MDGALVALWDALFKSSTKQEPSEPRSSNRADIDLTAMSCIRDTPPLISSVVQPEEELRSVILTPLYRLLDDVQRFPNQTPEYITKMMHKIPSADVVDRVGFILEKCKGKRVLNLGSASGGLHEQIKSVAASVYGVDRNQPCDFEYNLDDVFTQDHRWPKDVNPDIVVVGEVIEHLANPGRLLELLRWAHPSAELLVTVPNAACLGTSPYLKQGIENVNLDHVAWYSHKTLKTLLERYGFTITGFYWYNGQPRTAEGLIMTAR